MTENLLKSIPILQKLEAKELANLGKLVRPQSCKKGSHIILSDQSGAEMMFLAKGKVNISRDSAKGKEVILTRLNAGDFFGEISVLTGQSRSANVVAVTDCEILVLSKSDLDKHFKEYSGFSVVLLRELANRLRIASDTIGDFALLDVTQRLAKTVRKLAKKFEVGPGKVLLMVEDRPTHQELASMVGTSREIVTRALKVLEQEGSLKIEGKNIHVFDR